MTHDDAQRLITRMRNASAPEYSILIRECADALEAVMLERIDILDTCSRKIQDQRTIADEAVTRKEELQAQLTEAEEKHSQELFKARGSLISTNEPKDT